MTSSDTKSIARGKVLKRLAVRDHSVAEIRAFLARNGFNETLIENVILELRTEGLLDDQRFARALSASCVARGKGPAYILAKLRQKGVSVSSHDAKQLFREVMSEGEEMELARKIIARKYPEANRSMKIYRRAHQALLRNGFSTDLIRKALGAPPLSE
ncbi:MAG TPA: regulatory protein RecX [Bdellovibrionota bacterium]|nr:regulatory protein RecX [Bdellovibrionota bacterium]